MAVYVDTARNPYGRMIMCHMISDDIEDLLEMADRIGLARRHFQPGSHPHFDVSLGYRKKALQLGAIEVDRRELVAKMKSYRGRLMNDKAEADRLSAASAQSDVTRKRLRDLQKSG